MSGRDRLIVGGLGLSIVLSVVIVGLRSVIVKFGASSGRDDPNVVSLMRSPSDTKAPTIDQPTSVPTEVLEASDLSPTLTPILEGAGSGEDIEDVLLLYSGSNGTLFDTNFCLIAEYYGLLCKKVDLDLVILTDDVFKDKEGGYFKLIGIQAEYLLLNRYLVSSSERDVIKSVIEQAGATLLVSELTDENFPIALVSLTNGAVQGVVKPTDASKDWIVSSEAPEFTRELSGQIFTRDSEFSPHDFGIVFGERVFATPLISSIDDQENEYALIATVDVGSGQVIVDASQESPLLDTYSLRGLFYNVEWFSRIIPLMMSVRYAMGDEAWHSDYDFANLTIDDLALTKDIPSMDYAALLREMRAHNFHTTIGFVPAKWEKTEAEVASLFRTNPTLYSIAQHGNNADGYEFYKYEVNSRDWTAGDPEPARPIEDQEADILEGLNRLDQHWARYNIPYDRIMIFPGVPPEKTIELLKRHNYLSTVNSTNIPLDEDRPVDWDYGMYQASLEFGNFPMISRIYLGDLESIEENFQSILINLFIDKPALMFSSAGQLFGGEMDSFSPFADRLNKVEGTLAWQSLGYIIQHLYLEKVNDDGSVDIKMYTNNLILDNNSNQDIDYHLAKNETLNLPISSVTVNGQEFPYIVWDGILQIDLAVPVGVSAEILIQYESLDVDT